MANGYFLSNVFFILSWEYDTMKKRLLCKLGIHRWKNNTMTVTDEKGNILIPLVELGEDCIFCGDGMI